MKTLLVQPHGLIGAKNIRLVVDENGNYARKIKVDMSTFPDAAVREDAYKSGWLDISPYWEEPYDLVVENGILKYKSKNQVELETCVCDYPNRNSMTMEQWEKADGHFNQASGYCCSHYGNTCGHCHQYN